MLKEFSDFDYTTWSCHSACAAYGAECTEFAVRRVAPMTCSLYKSGCGKSQASDVSWYRRAADNLVAQGVTPGTCTHSMDNMLKADSLVQTQCAAITNENECNRFQGNFMITEFKRYQTKQEYLDTFTGKTRDECVVLCLQRPNQECKGFEYIRSSLSCQLTMFNQYNRLSTSVNLVDDADTDVYERINKHEGFHLRYENVI